MGSFVDPAYIERLHEDIKIACQRLEENGHESLVITVSNDFTHAVAGSRLGTDFAQNKEVLVTEFVKYCSDSRLTIKLEKDANIILSRNGKTANSSYLKNDVISTEPLNMAIPHDEYDDDDDENNMFDDDTDDYDDTEYISLGALDELDLSLDYKNTESTTKEKDNLIAEEDIKTEPDTDNSKTLRKRNAPNLNAVSKKLQKVEVILTKLKDDTTSKITGSKTKISEEAHAVVKPPEPKVATAIKTKEGYVKCSICNQFLSNEGSIVEHAAAHQALTCQYCNKLFRLHKFLDEHLEKYCEYTTRNVPCSQCKKVFDTKLDLNIHVEKTHEKQRKEGKFPCGKCKCVFRFEDHLNEHSQREANCKTVLEAAEDLQNSDKVKEEEVSYTDPVTGKTKVKTIKQLLAGVKGGVTKCEVCQKTLESKKSIIRHIYTHASLRPYVCNICFNTFGNDENYKRHLMRHDSRPYYCIKCYLRFETKASLEHHMKGSCKDSPDTPDLVCKVCQYEARSKRDLRIHKKTHPPVEAPPEMKACDFCDEKFPEKDSLEKHIQDRHIQEQMYECPICCKGFKHQKMLKRHFRFHGEKKHKCEICPYEGIDARSLRVHMQIHTDQKAFMCDICGKGFRNKYYLDTHRRIHTGERPFVCDFPGCDKGFRNTDSLKNHKALHATSHAYVCDICGKGFKIRGQLGHHRLYHTVDFRWPCQYCEEKFGKKNHYKQHIVRKHPEKTDEIESKTKNRFYKCETCPKIFAKKDHWREHTNMHKGLKPWKCTHCGKGFSSKANCRQHEKSHTGVRKLRCSYCSRIYSDYEVYKQHLMEKHGATAPPQSEVEVKAELRTGTRTVKAEEECQEAIEYVIKGNETETHDTEVMDLSCQPTLIAEPLFPGITALQALTSQEES